jgi:hypothetical protein
METQAIVLLVIGTVVMLSVPALVWSTAITDLYQLVLDKVRAQRSYRERYPFPEEVG